MQIYIDIAFAIFHKQMGGAMENVNTFVTGRSGIGALVTSRADVARVPFGAVAPALKEEWLPFTIKLVRSQQDLDKAVQIRHEAYARHLPEFAQSLLRAERADYEPGVAVLLAESKLDGSPLGTMRIQTNRHRALTLEESVALPLELRDATLAEATRLGVTQASAGRLVKTALFKAFFLYCQMDRVDYMVIAGRAPIDRQYERLMFSDVFPDQGFVPLKHAGDLPHRIMSFEVATAQARWAAAKHPLYQFVFQTRHPDIALAQTPSAEGTSASLDWPTMGAVASLTQQ